MDRCRPSKAARQLGDEFFDPANWPDVLKNDTRAVFSAGITRAAADFLNGLQPTAAASRTKSGR